MQQRAGRQLLPAIRDNDDTMKKPMLIPATLVILLCLAGNGFSIAVSPSVISAGELQRGNAYVYESYITNTDTVPITLALDITPRSEYLENFVTVTPETLTIGPGKKELVKIELSIPNVSTEVTNGTHILTILPSTDATGAHGVQIISTSVIELRFTIPGIVKDSLTLETFNAPDAEIGQTILFELYAKNTGNIRARAFPFVEIYRYGAKIDTANGITEYAIEPSNSVKMNVRYGTSSLESGKYRAVAYVEYSDSKRTNILEDTFKIKSKEKEDQPAQESQPSKDTETPVSQETPYPGEEDTISIGGSPNGQETVSVTKPDTKESDIQIRNLTAESKGKTVLITLELENTGTKDVDYTLEFHIFDNFQKKLATLISAGHIKGTETLQIKKSWDAPHDGNYTINAQVTYSKYNGTFIKTARKETSVEVKEDRDKLTGLIFSTSNISKIIILILLSAILLILALRKKNRDTLCQAFSSIGYTLYAIKKRDKFHTLKSTSKTYKTVEFNLEKITKESENLRKRIQRLKHQNTEKENRK